MTNVSIAARRGFPKSLAGRARLRALLVVGIMAFLAPASAFADTEPNNVISAAEGPIAGGINLTGSMGAPDDVDYYLFYVAGQQQVHFTASDVSGNSSCDIRASLEDTDGQRLDSDYTTPPGYNRYFVQISDDSYGDCPYPHPYSFQVAPASALVPGPALDKRLVPTGEPNESPAQASGPLAGYVNYTGSTQTANDQDWFYFYVAPGPHQVDISMTKPVQECSYGATISLYAGSDLDSSVASAEGDEYSFGHITQTLTGPTKYYLSASAYGNTDCLGSHWQFRISPAGALTPTLYVAPPPPPSAQCISAKKASKHWERVIRANKKKLKHAHHRSTKRRLRKALASERRALKRARSRITFYC